VYEHKLKAERALGRALGPDETVHHIDGDKTNNANSNLLICSRAYHVALHARLADSQDWPQFSRHNKSPRGQTRPKGSTPFKGVERSGGTWTAAASINGRKHRLGKFATPEDAARAYDEFVIVARGPGWVTNKSLGLL
jgi:hypothetical protein